MGWEVLKPKTWVMCLIYVFLVTLVVHVFTVQTLDSLDVSAQLPGAMSEVQNADDDIYEIPFIGAILKFGNLIFGFITTFIDILTFNIANPVGLPVYLTWIPFIMVFPVWIVILVGLLPYVLELIGHIAKYFDAVTPFT